MSVRFGYVTPTKMAIYGNVCEFVVTLMVIIILVVIESVASPPTFSPRIRSYYHNMIIIIQEFYNLSQRLVSSLTSAPYCLPATKSSGAAYSGEPQWVESSSPASWWLLSPKSEGGIVINRGSAYLDKSYFKTFTLQVISTTKSQHNFYRQKFCGYSMAIIMPCFLILKHNFSFPYCLGFHILFVPWKPPLLRLPSQW